MSQIFKGQCKVSNIADVEQACKALGWKLQKGGRLRWYRTQQGQECQYTIEFAESERDRYQKPLHHRYNIGLVKGTDGKFDVLHDNAMNGAESPNAKSMDETTERVIGKFRQALAKAAILRQTRAARRSILRQEVLADGTIRIVTE